MKRRQPTIVGSKGNDELETLVDAVVERRQKQAVAVPPPPYSGGVVCLLVVLFLVALLALVAGALTYWRVTSLEAKLTAILPNATEMLAEQQSLEMRAVREAANAFRKRQQP